MSASVILSILALYTSGFLFLGAGFSGLKRFSQDEGQKFFLYGLILIGTTLGPFMGTRTIFGILGYEMVDFHLSVAGQFLVSLSMFCFFLYLANRNLGEEKYKKFKKILFFLLPLFILAFFYGLWDNALTGPHISKWGTEYEPTGYARIVIISIWLVLLLGSLYSLISQIIKKRQQNKKRLDLYIGLIFFLFLLFFIPEEMGRMNTWKLVFSRVTSNVVAVAFYLIYTKNYQNTELLNNSE